MHNKHAATLTGVAARGLNVALNNKNAFQNVFLLFLRCKTYKMQIDPITSSDHEALPTAYAENGVSPSPSFT